MSIIPVAKIVQKPSHLYSLSSIEKTTAEELNRSGVTIKQGSQIAIAVGSRGISQIHEVVKVVVQWVKDKGGSPFVIPAMGSHGGATPEGQREVLESYGVKEEYIGAPIYPSLEVAELPKGNLPNQVYMSKIAYEADGTIIINRVKPHTDFHGRTESGLIKMCVIGLGKHKGALEIHRFGVRGLKELIPKTAQQIIKYGNILLGLAIVENSSHHIMVIKAVKPSDFTIEEEKLLKLARENMPALPVDKLDILVVDQMGKDISGSGIDTNVIGRMKIEGEPEPEKPDIKIIIVRNLTDQSHGNATGMGLADIITEKFYRKIDFPSTYENIVTSTFLERGKMPLVAKNDRQALQWAIRASQSVDLEKTRLIRIKDTLSLAHMYVSPSVFSEIKADKNVEMIEDFKDLLLPGEEELEDF